MPDRLLSPLFPLSRRNERAPRAFAVDAALVIAGIVAATAVRKWLSPALGPLFPFATYSLVAILLGCLWNVRSGVGAMLAGLIAGSYYFTSPVYSLLPDSVGGWVGDGFYLLTNGIILGLSNQQTRARLAAECLAVEAREAREALGVEERRWRNLVEVITDAFVALDREWRYTYVNENAARILGIPRKELVGRRLWDVFPSAVDGPMHEAMTQAAADGLPRTIDVYDAERSAWYENHIYPSAEGIIVIFRDVTERRRADEKVRESEVRFRELADSMPQIVWTAGADGSVDYYNRQFSTYTGMSVEDAIGDGWLAGVYPEDQARTVEAWQRAVQSGEQCECEHRVRRADGSYRWLLSRGVRYKGADSKVVRWYGSATDIDDLKRAQQISQSHTAEVEGLNARLRRAMAETHHRVKNNLQVITALVDMQTMTDESHVPVTEFVRIGQHIKSLAVIHDLLTANAKVSGDPDTVRTTEVMEKLAPLLKSIVGERNIRFDVESMDLALRQGTSLAVLVNELISNAVKHGSGDIEVSLAVVNERAKLAVSDRGPGFQEGFDPRKAANTGLELIESIGRLDLQGTTTYENRPEGGARVVVEFPRPRNAETAPWPITQSMKP
jgi:PAS domain S-box-containing protein